MQIFIWRTLREKVTVKSGEKEERETRPGRREAVSRDETEHGKEVSSEESAEIFASVEPHTRRVCKERPKTAS